MAKEYLSVEDVLTSMAAKRNDKGEIVYNRFSKKSFEKLMKAMLNDVEFKTTVANVKNDELVSVDAIEVTKGFREFCKKIIEKAGVDKAESERILTEEFKIENVSGLYEFFATAMYLYIEQGNKFDFIPKEDFKGSIMINEVAASKTEAKPAYHPQTREYLGDYETEKKAHKTVKVKSTCPSYLKKRVKVK